MSQSHLKLGTRGSALALTQSQQVADAIASKTGCTVELVTIKTRGDVITDRPLNLVGGKGVFTKEIENALISGDVDFAVHSMKDLPGENPEELAIAAIPERQDPRDVLVGAGLAELRAGSIVGTGSARRREQLRDLLPDVHIRGIRGNVDTRISKQRSGEYGAIVLAAAGIARLGRTDEVTEFLDVEAMVPSVGQGALAIQSRASDEGVRRLLESIHHEQTSIQILAERAFLIAMSGGCSIPAACHARFRDGQLELLGFYAPSNEDHRRHRLIGPPEDAVPMGLEMAKAVNPEL